MLPFHHPHFPSIAVKSKPKVERVTVTDNINVSQYTMSVAVK